MKIKILDKEGKIKEIKVWVPTKEDDKAIISELRRDKIEIND